MDTNQLLPLSSRNRCLNLAKALSDQRTAVDLQGDGVVDGWMSLDFLEPLKK